MDYFYNIFNIFSHFYVFSMLFIKFQILLILYFQFLKLRILFCFLILLAFNYSYFNLSRKFPFSNSSIVILLLIDITSFNQQCFHLCFCVLNIFQCFEILCSHYLRSNNLLLLLFNISIYCKCISCCI